MRFAREREGGGNTGKAAAGKSTRRRSYIFQLIIGSLEELTNILTCKQCKSFRPQKCAKIQNILLNLNNSKLPILIYLNHQKSCAQYVLQCQSKQAIRHIEAKVETLVILMGFSTQEQVAVKLTFSISLPNRIEHQTYNHAKIHQLSFGAGFYQRISIFKKTFSREVKTDISVSQNNKTADRLCSKAILWLLTTQHFRFDAVDNVKVVRLKLDSQLSKS